MFWDECMALARCVFDQADCELSTMIFSSVQVSHLSHTSFQELSGDISCLAPQIGLFVEFSAWH